MVIRRGEEWGEAAPLPDNAPIVGSDHELAQLYEDHPAEVLGPVGLLGGDLCRTLGGRGEEAGLRRPEAHTLPCDVGVATWDGGESVFVAHCVARPWRYSGRWFVGMNAAWISDRNVAPKAHPGDGRLDILETSLSVPDRVKAARRLRLGGHVPHPDIRMRRINSVTVDFPRPVLLTLDGVAVGRTRRLSLRVQPEAILVVV